MPPKSRLGEGSAKIKDIFKPRQVQGQTAADAANVTTADAPAIAPAAALPDNPAAAASTDAATGVTTAGAEFVAPAPKTPSQVTQLTVDDSGSAAGERQNIRAPTATADDIGTDAGPHCSQTVLDRPVSSPTAS